MRRRRRREKREETYIEHCVEGVEGLFFNHVGQEQPCDEPHALAIAYFRIQGCVPLQQVTQCGLTQSVLLCKQDVSRKRAVDISLYLIISTTTLDNIR